MTNHFQIWPNFVVSHPSNVYAGYAYICDYRSSSNRPKYVVSTAVHVFSHPTLHDSSRIFQNSSKVYTVIFAHIFQKIRTQHDSNVLSFFGHCAVEPNRSWQSCGLNDLSGHWCVGEFDIGVWFSHVLSCRYYGCSPRGIHRAITKQVYFCQTAPAVSRGLLVWCGCGNVTGIDQIGCFGGFRLVDVVLGNSELLFCYSRSQIHW